MASNLVTRGAAPQSGQTENLTKNSALTHGELNNNFYTLYVTPGTAEGGKALVVDGSKNISTLGTVTAGTFVGAVTGNVTGDVTGDITGNVTGNVTGDLTGDVTGNVTGDVTGDLTGNVTGNLTGDVTGDVTGNADTATTATATTALKTDPSGSGTLANGSTEVFISTGYTYTAAAQALTAQAHGLSGIPQDLSAVMECLDNTVDTWAVVGNYYPVTVGIDSGVGIMADATNLTGKVDGGGIALTKMDSGFADVLSTASDWKIYLIAKYYA